MRAKNPVFSGILHISWILFLLLPLAAFPDEGFFSSERYVFSGDVLKKAVKDKRIYNELIGFMTEFNNGMDTFTQGLLPDAEKHFMKARGIWPEHFGADFMLALTHENNGDIKTAAMFYKSYLGKLQKFHAGKYHISEYFIRASMFSKVESYRDAYNNVKDKLAARGINIDMTPAFPGLPGLVSAVIFGVCAAFIFVIFKIAMFYMRIWRELRSVPDGFWLCRACRAVNPGLSGECVECRRKREQHGEQ